MIEKRDCGRNPFYVMGKALLGLGGWCGLARKVVRCHLIHTTICCLAAHGCYRPAHLHPSTLLVAIVDAKPVSGLP
eukprot:NODE_3616_length_537_cov_16.694672_g3070_i0.p2 GENE.NODE_3616_length_537_cov_16.694672_g3070_i0~~NODE_3616_length_537_cov_16.694672_g3070_i0.p2  ORF type:complete len:76 (+),score=5.47 NODE_3616_length_537_cov_16.694672_g3070_i0:261-488(+)